MVSLTYKQQRDRSSDGHRLKTKTFSAMKLEVEIRTWSQLDGHYLEAYSPILSYTYTRSGCDEG